MIVTVNPEQLLSLVPPCPEWCVDSRDHDVDDLAKGARSRFHCSPAPEGSANVLFDDNPDSPTPWSFDPLEVELVGVSAGDLAKEVRWYIAGLTRTAEWLEALS